MKKSIFLILTMLCVGLSPKAQSIAEGIPYQGVVRDASGLPLVKAPVTLRVALGAVEKSNSATFYSEMHEAQTDEQGFFQIVIGEGKDAKGALSDVPWATCQIWAEVALQTSALPAFRVLSHSRLLAVPYAMHAGTATQLTQPTNEEEKNQSIYWTTGGNSLTAPPTHFLGTRDNQDLVFKTNNTTRVNFSKEGQMEVFSGVNGDDDNINSYPMTVEGSNQGIYIKVNGSRDGDHNFVNFGDDQEFTWGEIEGQTIPELEADWEYQLQVALYTLNGIALGGSIVAWGAAAVGAFASGLNAGSGAAIILDLAGLAVDLANLLQESITWGINIRNDIGVTYSSGAADYAEWLERAAGIRDVYAGEIVGVTGGLVSLNTQNADHLFVVSSNPLALGNQPAAADQKRFEKIAFMGQVRTRVLGPVSVGDYILPSGNNDGFAIAVHPSEMKPGDYSRIIGVSWENGLSNVPFNLVNVAVGINANDLSREVVALEKKVEAIMAYLKGQSASVTGEAGALTASQYLTTAPKVEGGKVFTDQEFDQVLDSNSEMLNELFAQTKARLIEMGNSPEAHPRLMAFLDNPVPVLKQIRRDPRFFNQWVQVDHNIQANQKK